ncbi:serine arginine repetitive matrix [Plasmopara halstedii]|uniref:Serine arginine repetitive matrix n=1 Tax=Plasmopara halstedii TaxID=4781 RepID=A0A0P1ABZ6_PLAHL|nr:serine arginine repetitive matrix [Plasmopara halstedii]CEG38040.1 serine arginine repetitive matrix [Plasmopara halstedii]|eukprot:XP_024574409.1 serine arginine repetitive matrix [Plasmopara halstedii]
MGIRGTSANQDGRYFAQEKKLLAKMSFPECFEQHVDMRKVQREVINQWITERITHLLGFEDDIVVSMAINLLEPKVDVKLDPKQLQMTLTGFLEKQAGPFTEELWQLLLSAQGNPTGIPTIILDKKKMELQSIAKEKDNLKKVLDAKRKGHENESRGPKEDTTDRPSLRDRGRRRSRSFQRRPRNPPKVIHSPSRSMSEEIQPKSLQNSHRRRCSPSPLKRSSSPRKYSLGLRRRSPSSRRRSSKYHRRSSRQPRRSLSPRRRSPRSSKRSRYSSREHSRRQISRSPSVKRRDRYRVHNRRSERRQRSSRREIRSRRTWHSPSLSSSVSRHRSPSTSRSPSLQRRSSRRSRKESTDSGSDSE